MITSNSNEKIKHIALLMSNARARKTEKSFVVEGERMVREIPANRIKECYVSESFDKLSCIPSGVKYETVSDSVFKKMSDTKTPQGVMCVVSKEELTLSDFLKMNEGKPAKLLVLERVQDPGNIGTMIRTAEGAGFAGILADNNTVDVYNPKVTRSTMGSLFRMPVIYTDNLIDALKVLKQSEYELYAAHLKGDADYRKITYSDRSAVLIGNEGNGLSDEVSGICDTLVKIPMEGKVESLNAAVAAALMMYEVTRS